MELRHYLFLGWLAFWIIGHFVISANNTVINTTDDKRFKSGKRVTSKYSKKGKTRKLILFSIFNICIYGIIVFFNRL